MPSGASRRADVLDSAVPVPYLAVHDLTPPLSDSVHPDAPTTDGPPPPHPPWSSLSLHLDRGDVLLVRGPSGCGKTTLLRALAHLVPVSSGSVALCGRAAPNDPAWYRSRVAYVAQRAPLVAGSPLDLWRSLLDFQANADARRPRRAPPPRDHLGETEARGRASVAATPTPRWWTRLGAAVGGRWLGSESPSDPHSRRRGDVEREALLHDPTSDVRRRGPGWRLEDLDGEGQEESRGGDEAVESPRGHHRHDDVAATTTTTTTHAAEAPPGPREPRGAVTLPDDPSETAESLLLLPRDAMGRAWSTLSGGEAQRAALALALSLKARRFGEGVLLLDEPTSALDDATARRVEESLLLAVLTLTLVVITHSDAQATRIARLARRGRRDDDDDVVVVPPRSSSDDDDGDGDVDVEAGRPRGRDSGRSNGGRTSRGTGRQRRVLCLTLGAPPTTTADARHDDDADG